MADDSAPRRFLEIVLKLLDVKEFRSGIFGESSRDEGFDLLADHRNEKWAIEVKYYRTERAQVPLIELAARRLIRRGILVGAQRGMLVVSCALLSATKEALETQHSLTLVDRFDLFAWAAAKPWLLEELESILEVDSRQPFDLPRAKTEPQIIGDRPLPREAPHEDRPGSELAAQLTALKRGRAGWVRYEALCDQMLRYLFPKDLHGWHKQRRTDDGLNRFDYVCRIKPATEFWQFLIDHLNSRYVLFEFKNHAGKIKQGQILTTEKYLLDKGLRRVALILSRAGADESAIAMAQGAMREHGKLILVLDDVQVIEMLRGKERGDDPTDLLFNLADDFLLKLPR